MEAPTRAIVSGLCPAGCPGPRRRGSFARGDEPTVCSPVRSSASRDKHRACGRAAAWWGPPDWAVPLRGLEQGADGSSRRAWRAGRCAFAPGSAAHGAGGVPPGWARTHPGSRGPAVRTPSVTASRCRPLPHPHTSRGAGRAPRGCVSGAAKATRRPASQLHACNDTVTRGHGTRTRRSAQGGPRAGQHGPPEVGVGWPSAAPARGTTATPGPGGQPSPTTYPGPRCVASARSFARRPRRESKAAATLPAKISRFVRRGEISSANTDAGGPR